MFETFFSQNVTQRIKGLREAYLQSPLQTQSHPYFYSTERWLILPYLEGWLNHQKETTTVIRRAKTKAYVLDCYQSIILEEELIVGQMDHHELSDEEQARYRQGTRHVRKEKSYGSFGE